MANATINKAVQRISANVPGAYSYIFDAADNRFLYQSEINEKLEAEILKMNKEKGLGRLVQESQEGVYSITCQNTGRVFLIRKMAADLFFGLCVEKKPETIAQAESLMRVEPVN